MTDRAEFGKTVGVSRRAAMVHGTLAAGLVAGIGRLAAPLSAAQTPEASPVTSDAGVPDDFKVVLHAAEIENWDFVLSNLRNLTQEWPKARLRVVVDGSAVSGLQGENNLTTALGELAEKGVLVQICPNALRDQGIDPATVPTYAQTSLGGVVALVLAQHEGFAYVKP